MNAAKLLMSEEDLAEDNPDYWSVRPTPTFLYLFLQFHHIVNMIPPFPLQDSDFWLEVKATGCADSTGEEFYFPAAHCFILYRSKATERLVGIVSLTYSLDSEYSGIIPEYFGSIRIFRNIPEYSGIFQSSLSSLSTPPTRRPCMPRQCKVKPTKTQKSKKGKKFKELVKMCSNTVTAGPKNKPSVYCRTLLVWKEYVQRVYKKTKKTPAKHDIPSSSEVCKNCIRLVTNIPSLCSTGG
jgi:hypothetical protein